MKVLVVGAAGFVGQRLVRQLHAAGIEVIAGLRRPSPAFAAPGIEQRVMDAAKREDVAAALAGVTHVVNAVMAAPEVMVAATRNLAEEAAKAGVKRFIHLSSIAVYGDACGVLDEETPLNPVNTPYGLAKITCETWVSKAAAQGVETVIFRPALIYGPGSELWSARIARLLYARRLGDLGAAGDGLCNLVHIGDVVNAIHAALDAPGAAGQVFNLAQPNPPSWNRYLMDYAHALGATPVHRLPGWQMKLEGRLLAPPLKVMEILERFQRRLSRLNALSLCLNAIPDAKPVPTFAGIALEHVAQKWAPVLRNNMRKNKTIEHEFDSVKTRHALAQKLKIGITVPAPVTPSLIRLFSQDVHYPSAKAERVLGLRWTGYETGLAETAAFYKT